MLTKNSKWVKLNKKSFLGFSSKKNFGPTIHHKVTSKSTFANKTSKLKKQKQLLLISKIHYMCIQCTCTVHTPYLGTCNIHSSSHESVLCLLHIIDLQDISTSKLYFIKKWLTVLKEINWEANSGGFYSGFTCFLLADWLHYT